MSKFSLPVIVDALLSGFICYFTVSAILYSFTRSSAFVVTLSIIVSLCVCALVFIVLTKKNELKRIGSKEKKRLDDTLKKLELLPDNQLIAIFSAFFKKAGIKHKALEDHVETERRLYYFNFAKELTRRDAVALIKKFAGKKIVLFCNEADDDCAMFCKENEDRISLSDKTTILNLERKYGNIFSETNAETVISSRKEKIKSYIVRLSTFKRALVVALSGAGILMFSRFTFFPKWYNFCGLTLMLFSAVLLLVRIIVRTKDKTETIELLN